jgi:hypothetical protein
MSKPDLLAMIRTAHAEWEALLADIPVAAMTEPGVMGEWSVKDVIAHITWGEREAIGVARAHALVGSELWQLSEDERNAAVFEQNRGRELHDVLSESRHVFQEYLAALAALSEVDLNDPHRFAGMPTDWRPWRVMYDPNHYHHHAQDIRAWLARRSIS